MSELPRLFGREVVARGNAEALAGALKALADPGRIQMLSLLLEHDEMTGQDLRLALGRLRQPTVSHHLGILHAAGLVSRRRDGVFIRYQVEPEGLRLLSEAIRPGGRR